MRRVGPLLLGALAVRLVLMPLTFHGDLLFIHYFPFFLSHNGVWDIYGHFGDHFIRQEGYIYYPPLVYYLTGLGQALLKSINPDFVSLMERHHSLYFHAIPAGEADYFAGYSAGRIFRLVFLMKLPYLFAEAGIVAFLWKLFGSEPQKRLRALRFWLWSPVVLFSIYVMGQHRAFTALFLCAALYALSRGRTGAAGLAMGAACLCDSAAWFLAPAAVLVFADTWKERFKVAGWILLPMAAVLLPLFFSSSGLVTTAYYAPLLQKQALQGIFRHAVPGLPAALKALFVFGCAAAWAAFWKKPAHPVPAESRVPAFSSACAAVLFMLYATTSTVIHYFMWIMPFMVVVCLQAPKAFRLKWASAVALLFFFNLDSPRLNLGLLTPLDPSYWPAQPSFHEWIHPFAPWWGSVIGFSRLVFSVLCVLLAWEALRAGRQAIAARAKA